MSDATGQPGIREIWSALRPEARQGVVADLGTVKETKGWPEKIERKVARALNFRLAKIHAAKREDVQRIFPIAVLRMDRQALTDLLCHLHIAHRSHLLRAFYDAIDVEHDDGIADQDTVGPLPLSEAIDALPGLIERFGAEEVWFFIHLLRLGGFEHWRDAAAALCSAFEEIQPSHAGRGSSGLVARDDSTPSPPTTEEEGALRGLPEFTTLDRALIRSIVSSLNEVEGSLSLDELDDLVGEIVALNESRERSHFFLGYLDSLLERPSKDMQAADNAARRAWYVSGFLHGALRRSAAGEVLELLDSLEEEDRERLFETPCHAGSLLAPALIPRLLEAGRIDEAIRWLESRFEFVAPDVLGPILQWSRTSLVAGDAEAVRKVLELTRTLIPEVNDGLQPVPPALKRAVERRLATAFRRTGRSEEASQIVESLLATCEDEVERAELLSDRALLKIGLRSLELVDLGKPETRGTLVAAIAANRAELQDAADRPTHTPIPPLLLALPAVLDPACSKAENKQARDYLQKALSSIKEAAFWRRTGVMQQIELGLAVLELRSLKLDVAPHAVNLLVGVLEDESTQPPLDLVTEALDNLALTDAPGTGRAVRAALARWPSLLGTIPLESIARRNAELRQLVTTILEETEVLNADERWRAWSGLLEASLGADPSDLDVARESLDQLETLAAEGQAQRFLDLLEKEKNWDPAWTRLERDEAEIRLLEGTGQLTQAAAVLTNLIYRTISQGEDAEDLLYWLRSLPVNKEEVHDLERRIQSQVEADEPAAAEGEERPACPVRILFIGGNETQKAFRDHIERWLQERHPGCSVDFEFAGWTSNWGPLVDRLAARLESADVMVLMRFLRTMLGRRLRREADRYEIPWVPCSGHGRESLKRAITKAIAVARQQTKESAA